MTPRPPRCQLPRNTLIKNVYLTHVLETEAEMVQIHGQYFSRDVITRPLQHQILCLVHTTDTDETREDCLVLSMSAVCNRHYWTAVELSNNIGVA